MFPIRDTNPSRNVPYVNSSIIALNVIIFMVQLAQGSGLDRFVYIYGLVPARYTIPHISSYFSVGQQLFAFLSFMFLHGGFWHLLGNMWSLYIFGDNVEDRLGPLRYIIFYLLCGLASGLSHLLLNQSSNIPTIGASGAIAGVMGAYLLLYPKAKVLTLIPIFIIPYFIEIPAFFFLGIWLLLQFVNVAGSQGGVAWWAHIGGFVFGMIFLKLFDLIPSSGMTKEIRKATVRKKAPRLQVIRPVGVSDDPHLYGVIQVTPFEALNGTHKMVNVPWGFHKRLIRVTVPPGVQNGNKLRLQGLGKLLPDGSGKGDLYLKVTIRS
ncbi:rhomboid family intramembrane serine protease [Thermodesulfobacteriota bacterium]